jgi:hypothetical protein
MHSKYRAICQNHLILEKRKPLGTKQYELFNSCHQNEIRFSHTKYWGGRTGKYAKKSSTFSFKKHGIVGI